MSKITSKESKAFQKVADAELEKWKVSALKIYREFLQKRRNGSNHLPEARLDQAHQSGQKQALDHFEKSVKSCSDAEGIRKLKTQLVSDMVKEFVGIKRHNDAERSHFIQSLMSVSQASFLAQMEELVPLEDKQTGNEKFHEEDDIHKAAEQTKTVILDDFKWNISNEGEEITSHIQSLEKLLSETLSVYLDKNKNHKRKFQTQRDQEMAETARNQTCQDYEAYLHATVSDNLTKLLETLEEAHKNQILDNLRKTSSLPEENEAKMRFELRLQQIFNSTRTQVVDWKGQLENSRGSTATENKIEPKRNETSRAPKLTTATSVETGKLQRSSVDKNEASQNKQHAEPLSREQLEMIQGKEIAIAKNEYNDTMKVFLKENAYQSNELLQIHTEVQQKCLEAFQMNSIKLVSCGSLVQAEIPKALETLRADLAKSFESHQVANDIKLKRLQLETNKIIQSHKTQYTERMKEILKRNPEGVENDVLQKQHETIGTEVRKLMEIEIKKKIGSEERMEQHLQSLQRHIDAYWKCTSTENTTTLNSHKKKSTKWTNVLKQMQARKKFTSATGVGFTRMDAGSSTSSSLSPLVFQLMSTRVVMGMMVEGKPEVLSNELKEPHTPAVIGLTTDNKLIFGTEAEKRSLLDKIQGARENQLKNYWKISDCLIKGDTPWEDRIQIGDGFHRITVEFLLGFLLRKLKLSAESRFGGTSSTAVITVPFWLSSSQRIQAKDAARVAGFSEVFLVNEQSAAAYALASERRKDLASSLLVLSENANNIDATVFDYRRRPMKITMMGHCGSYNREPHNKGRSRPSPLRSFNSAILIKSLEHFFGVGNSGSAGSSDISEDLVRKICRKALGQCQSGSKGSPGSASGLTVKEVLVICESANHQGLLENVGREQGNRVADFNENLAVITGAVSLSQDPKLIGYQISDKMAFDILRQGAGSEDPVLVINKTSTLPHPSKKITNVLPSSSMDARFYQVDTMDSVVPIGDLKLMEGSWLQAENEIETCFDLSNEGILDLKCVAFRKRTGNSEYLTPDQFHWTTPNLSDDDVVKFASLLELQIQSRTRRSPHTSSSPPKRTDSRKEGSLTAEARQKLLQRCEEMVEWYAKNHETTFKSDLAREFYITKVNEAESLCYHPNTSVDELRKRFDALDKYYTKYCKESYEY